MTPQPPGLSEHLTHKANLRHTRYGWLRLTPAYSVHLVQQLLEHVPSSGAVVLDPFCGTGTTALVCAERGIAADTTDINPFLLWLTETKTGSYAANDIDDLHAASETIVAAITRHTTGEVWVPPIHQVEKWWGADTLRVLGRIVHAIRGMEHTYAAQTIDLLKIAFCRVMITHSSASFNHQSMSFKKQHAHTALNNPIEDVRITWQAAVDDISRAARTPILAPPRALLCDARQLSAALPHNHYTCVLTSPPYPNRMSYIRELRPYMYWLGYLNDSKAAGELDWQAIGGTWGAATSNAGKWSPPASRSIPHPRFASILERIAAKSDLLSRYVHKYFYDMADHVQELLAVTRSGGSISYIVGNSKFYDVLLPVEEIFAGLFEAAGFVDVGVRPIRKRTSKKELYEYVVSAVKP